MPQSTTVSTGCPRCGASLRIRVEAISPPKRTAPAPSNDRLRQRPTDTIAQARAREALNERAKEPPWVAGSDVITRIGNEMRRRGIQNITSCPHDRLGELIELFQTFGKENL
jgi:hypothetical protein